MSVPSTSKAPLIWIQKREKSVIAWKDRLLVYGLGYMIDASNDDNEFDHLLLVGKHLFRGRIKTTQLIRGGGGRVEGYLGAMLSSTLLPPAGHDDVCIRAWVLQTKYEQDPARGDGPEMRRIRARPGFDAATQAAIKHLREGLQIRAGTYITPAGTPIDEGDRQSMVKYIEDIVKDIVVKAMKGDPFFKYVSTRDEFLPRARILADNPPAGAPNIPSLTGLRIRDKVMFEGAEINVDAVEIERELRHGAGLANQNLERRLIQAVQGVRTMVLAPGWGPLDLVPKLHGDGAVRGIAQVLQPLSFAERDVLFAAAVIAVRYGEVRCLQGNGQYREVAVSLRRLLPRIRMARLNPGARADKSDDEDDDQNDWWGFTWE